MSFASERMVGAAVIAFASAGCWLAADFRSGGDAGSTSDAAAETGTDAGTGGCPDGGTGMVRIGAYCIDRTEVTNGQVAAFNAFVGATPDWDAGLPSRCKGANLVFGGSGTNDQPASRGGQCAAAAYCAWVGKRLCGKIGGGPETNAAELVDEKADEWHRACTGGNGRTYPYGNTFQPNACNLQPLDAGDTVAVGSLPLCAGGEPGLFDMAGNVAEWTSYCSDAGECVVRGASFADYNGDPTRLGRCNEIVLRQLPTSEEGIGVRCCADAR